MLDLKEMLSERMQEIFDELNETNIRYADCRKQCLDLIDIVNKLIITKGDQTITENDRQRLKKYLDINLEMQGIEQEEYYFHGYLDCVSFLKQLNLF